MAAPFLDFGNRYAEGFKIGGGDAEVSPYAEGGQGSLFDKRSHSLARTRQLVGHFGDGKTFSQFWPLFGPLEEGKKPCRASSSGI